MSPPIWLRESYNRKTGKSNVKHFSNQKESSNEDLQAIQDIFLELQTVLNEKAILKSENSSLKTELTDLRTTNENLMKAVQINKEKFEEDLNKLQQDIKANENHLIDNTKKCLFQQKKYVEELKELKSQNATLSLEITNKERELTEKIISLETELKLAQLAITTERHHNKESGQKISKYKSKLKYAITIINDLNNVLVEHTLKPETNTVGVQVENESPDPDLQEKKVPIQPKELHYETENMLLSDIFFKSKTFCETELPFVHKGSLPNFNNVITSQE